MVDVPPISYVVVDGEGEPGGPRFQQAIQALYSVSFTLRFIFKKSGKLDWVVGPLEALWWNNDSLGLELGGNPVPMKWRAMIAQPDEVTDADVERARAEAAKKRDLPALKHLQHLVYDEGLSVQVLHVGPYSEEEPTIAFLHAFAAENGYGLHKAHHEIYLNDPNRTHPSRIRTILRQPVTW